MAALGIPLSLLDEVIDEEDDGTSLSPLEDPGEHLNDLYDLLSAGMDTSATKQQIQRLSNELEHYKEMEGRLHVSLKYFFFVFTKT